ncbi:hypothetical protein OIU34_20310 [Pararhizobium sp. BT-229]|uniref:hypothetical protein n=1 Tax=Pararhizobium sp. BT-229 TaxID=2986923 RepID=UPI0021F764C7|nr:hypothetical protein [Pararhizobium sp. BT-229]MCV9964232.1 hypothetical protein [Pararhizobium sp. BT-229]
MHLSIPFQAYLFVWASVTAIALVVAIADRRVAADLRPYLKFLCMPWKIAVLVPAALFVTFAGRFAFDDTWDTVTGGGMSALAYLTAPWAVGTAYLVAVRQRPLHHGVIAVVTCLFSASWFYDAWLLYRDGYYSPMWLPNLLLSPFLYVAGGLLWNLEVDADGRSMFGFFRKDWPARPEHRQTGRWLALVCLPPVLVVATVLLFCVTWRF